MSVSKNRLELAREAGDASGADPDGQIERDRVQYLVNCDGLSMRDAQDMVQQAIEAAKRQQEAL